MPIWVANFVLGEYGTGAVMGVPGHDQRDFEFARKYNLPITVVVQTGRSDARRRRRWSRPTTGAGKLVNSGEFDGLDAEDAIEKMTAVAEERGIGEGTVQYRLKDWGISRQRYWGTPIPVLYCEKDGMVPVPADDLPVLLPKTVEFSGRGDSPLAHIPEFVNATVRSAAVPRGARRTRWTRSSTPRGTSSASAIRRTPICPSTPTRSGTGARSISTAAASSTPSCT